ncbi:MAG: DUF3102 domain-containing protein, partial [Acidaminococcaceae bacterium]|nr:DUF3102 domain-containing protein [Acidaminococcaceae bacterium]
MSVVDIGDKTMDKIQEEQRLLAEAQREEILNEVQGAEFTERTPEIVAAEIRQIADQTRKMVLNNSIEIGKRLCEAKEMVPHGEWGNWLDRSVNFSQSTANNFMKIYTEYGDIQGELWGASAKSQTFGNLTYSQAVALLAVPSEEREEFVENHDVEHMSTRELQEAIKARDEALAAKEKAEEELQDAIKSREKVIDDYCKQVENRIKKTERDLELAKKQLQNEKEMHENTKHRNEAVESQQAGEIERLKEQLAAAEAKESTATLAEAAE